MRRISGAWIDRLFDPGSLLYLGFLAIAMLLSGSLRAAEPLSCSNPVEGHWPYGPGYTVERWLGGGESLLLVGNGSVLSVINAADPANLTMLGEVSVSDGVRSIAISADGNLVAVSDWRSKVHLVDISNRAAPQARGSVQTSSYGQPYGLAIAGNRLYVAIRDVGLGVFNIADPDSVVLLGATASSGTNFVFDLKVRGNYAYLADDAEGVSVVDISNPATPTYVGAFAGSTLASRIVIEGARAYVARRGEGFDILDLTVPTSPTRLGTFDTPSIVYGVQTLGANRLLVADGYGGTTVYDISNPGAPAALGGESEPVYGVAAIGDHGFTLPDSSRPSHLRAINFSNPLAPVVRDSINFYNDTAEVRVVGSRVLVAQGDSGMSILDLSNPQEPVRVGGYLAGTDSVTDVEWVNGHAVVGSSGKLDIVDVANPASPQLVSTITVSDLLLDLDRNGNRLFVTWGFHGMKIYDLSYPAVPTLLGTFVPADGAIRVATQGNYAFVSDQTYHVHVIDVSNPASPQQVSQLALSSFIEDVSIEGFHLYIATQLQGVRVFDVSVPSAPIEVSNIPFSPAIANSLAARGNRLYAVAGEYGGLRSFDTGLPSSPMFIDEWQTPGEALWIDMADDTIAIAEGSLGVRTLRCAAPANDALFKNGFE